MFKRLRVSWGWSQKKFEGIEGEDVQDAEQERRDPLFTNPAWPELQWHPQPGSLTAVNPSCWDSRRMIIGCPGGVVEKLSRTGRETGRRSQLHGPLVLLRGREMSACGSQSNKSGWSGDVDGKGGIYHLTVVPQNCTLRLLLMVQSWLQWLNEYLMNETLDVVMSTLFTGSGVLYTITLKGRSRTSTSFWKIWP